MRLRHAKMLGLLDPPCNASTKSVVRHIGGPIFSGPRFGLTPSFWNVGICATCTCTHLFCVQANSVDLFFRHVTHLRLLFLHFISISCVIVLFTLSFMFFLYFSQFLTCWLICCTFLYFWLTFLSFFFFLQQFAIACNPRTCNALSFFSVAVLQLKNVVSTHPHTQIAHT